MAIFGNNTGTTPLADYRDGVFVLQSYVMPEDGTVTSLSAYVKTIDLGMSNYGRYKFGIYSNTVGNAPGNLLGETGVITPTDGIYSGQLLTGNLTSPLSLTAGTYWLAIIQNVPGYLGEDYTWSSCGNATNKDVWFYDPYEIE